MLYLFKTSACIKLYTSVFPFSSGIVPEFTKKLRHIACHRLLRCSIKDIATMFIYDRIIANIYSKDRLRCI